MGGGYLRFWWNSRNLSYSWSYSWSYGGGLPTGSRFGVIVEVIGALTWHDGFLLPQKMFCFHCVLSNPGSWGAPGSFRCKKALFPLCFDNSRRAERAGKFFAPKGFLFLMFQASLAHSFRPRIKSVGPRWWLWL